MEKLSSEQMAALQGGDWDQETACGALVGATVGMAVIGCPGAFVTGFWALAVC